jgi:hypothetical protein
MAGLRLAVAQQVSSTQGLQIEAGQHLSLEAPDARRPVTVDPDLERVAPRRPTIDADAIGRGSRVSYVPDLWLSHCSILYSRIFAR